MPWRYQPVYIDDDGERSYFLCEVYFDKEGRFEKWSDRVYASGTTIEDMSGDLTHMLVDTFSWVPVRYNDLRPGITFHRRLSMQERNDIADFIDSTSGAFKHRSNRPEPH